MSYDAGLVERLRDAIARLGEKGAREKNVFGGRGFLLGKSTFVIAWGDGIIAKMAPDDYEVARASEGVTAFAPEGERPMSTWVVVAADVIADDPELAEWVAKALRGVQTAPAVRKPSKRTTKPAVLEASAKRKPTNKAPARKTSAKKTLEPGGPNVRDSRRG